MEYDLAPVPDEATTLGTVEGITYIAMPDGNIWRNDGDWKLYCSGEMWPQTEIYLRMLAAAQVELADYSDDWDRRAAVGWAMQEH